MPLSVRHERIPHFITRPLFSSLPRCHEAGRIASAVGKSHLSFCVGRCASLFGRSDLRERRTPPLARIRGVRSSGVCSASGASTYSAASGIIRISTVLAPTLNVPARYLQPRLSREFPASASVPTAELRMFQPIFPYDLRRFISFHISVFLQTEPFFLHKFSTVTRCCKGRFALRVPPFFASLQKGNHPCFLQLLTTALLIVRKNRASAHKSNFKISQIWHVKLKNQPRTSQQPLPPQSKLPLP